MTCPQRHASVRHYEKGYWLQGHKILALNLNTCGGRQGVVCHGKVWQYRLDAVASTEIDEKGVASNSVPEMFHVLKQRALPFYTAENTLLIQQLKKVDIDADEHLKHLFSHIHRLLSTMRCVGIEKSEPKAKKKLVSNSRRNMRCRKLLSPPGLCSIIERG